jgi:hypothetical protein
MPVAAVDRVTSPAGRELAEAPAKEAVAPLTAAWLTLASLADAA